MENFFLQTIRKNRDAPYVNRGFYYQYLTVLKIWIRHFIEGTDTEVYTEVDNDIKEVGDKIIYTQVKCYISSFGLNSSTVKKELFGFFLLYLEQSVLNPELEFHFYTNTSAVKSDELLLKWIRKQPLKESKLQQQCTAKIREILLQQLNAEFEKNLHSDKFSEAQKTQASKGFQEIKGIINSEKLLDFVRRIFWHFGNETPEESVIALHASVMQDLSNEKFEGRPAPILMEAMLSEIYRCSQLSSTEDRKVDAQRLKAIIKFKDAELNAYINTGVIDILEVKFYAMNQRMTEIEQKMVLTSTKVEELLSDKEQQAAQLPKNLTFIPFINPRGIFGRETELEKLCKMLHDNSCILINSGGGLGKSALAKLYLHHNKDKYSHFLWLDCETGITESVAANEILAERIGLDPSIPLSKKFDTLINKLESIAEGGLLILDNLEGDLSQLSSFQNLGTWKVLATSRLRLADWITVELEKLPFSSAKTLYRHYEPNRPSNDELLEDLFGYIDYNTLAIELIAKTIHLSFDLTLEKFLEYLRGQRLDDDELDVELTDDSDNAKLLLLLNKTFNIRKFSSQERFYMEFFALLPSEGITLTDLVVLYGKENERGNRIEFARAVNSLHRKGLIKRTENVIKMDRMFQESVIYQSRKGLNPFLGQLFHISFMTARLEEGIQGNPQQAFHFYRYSKSILKNIKEPFRASIYQPLLLLENETLYVRSWLEKTDIMMPLWEDLLKRAAAYLGETAPMVGAISNNYALSLYGEKKSEKAKIYFDKAITISRINKINAPTMIHILLNRANIYIAESDVEGFKKLFDEILELRTKNDLPIDASFTLECHTLGKAHMQVRHYALAKENFALAIMSHKGLPQEQRNDMNLIIFLCDMAECCLALEQFETAEKAAVQASHYLDKLKISEGGHMISVLEILIAISQHNKDAENEKKLRAVLASKL